MSLDHLATRFACSWPWTTLVMLCDGRIVCGCADPMRSGDLVMPEHRLLPMSGKTRPFKPCGPI